jgi:hypothetical protein
VAQAATRLAELKAGYVVNPDLEPCDEHDDVLALVAERERFENEQREKQAQTNNHG